MTDERRSAHRTRISGVRVMYESADGERVEADALDLGPGGLFVRTAAPLAVGKRIALEIQIIGETGPWSALGRVVWIRDKGEGDQAPPGMGVKIIDAEETVIAAIERLVEAREHTEPGVGKPSTPPGPVGAPGTLATRGTERERTLLGVGASSPPSFPPAPMPPREPSIAIELVSPKATPAPPPAAVLEKPRGAARLIVVLLLIVVAGIAAFVLVDGFRH